MPKAVISPQLSRSSRTLLRLLPLALALAAPAADAQLSTSEYARAERLIGWNATKLVYHYPVAPQWIEDSDRFWYRKPVPAGHEFIYVDPTSDTQRPAFDHIRLAASLSIASGNVYEPYRLPFQEIELLEVGGEVTTPSIRFWETLTKPEQEASTKQEKPVDEVEEDPPERRWTCKLDSYDCVGPEDISADPDNEVASPDEQWVAFERDENLWLRDSESGEERQLTDDGEEHWGYAAIGQGCCSEITSRRNDVKRRPPIFWSPDSKRLATTRLDEREVGEMHLLEAKEGRPVLHSYRYALPGDVAVPTYRLWIFDLDTGSKSEVEGPSIELFWPGEEDVRWSEDNDSIYFVHLHRGYQKAEFYEADALTGESRVIFGETNNTFIELNMTFAEKADWRVTADGSKVVWRSERDGWGHFYLYDTASGALERRLTSGAYSAAGISHLDSEGQWLYFHGFGQEDGLNPYYPQLYRVRLDGTGLTRLTPEDAAHEISMPESGDYIVDTYSLRDQAPVTVLRSPDGSVVRTLEKADISALIATGWEPPEPFRVKARDGVTDLYGYLYRPSDFDPEAQPGKRYPIIDYIYPGPQIGSVRNWGFSADPSGNTQALAELGFVVVQVNALGTPFRSKAFHTAWYGDMTDNGIPDHIHAIKQLAARHPEIDLDRVGIYGHSGGGFSSTDAILRFPDFFDVAVSSAGNHDNRSYSYGWGEQYQGLLEKNEGGDNFTSQANHLLADRLRGKLMLTYGTLDDNVHPNATQLLIDALIEHNKDFDLLILPNRNHGYSREPYLIRRSWDYFVRHLLGENPPKEYEIAPAPPS